MTVLQVVAIVIGLGVLGLAGLVALAFWAFSDDRIVDLSEGT